MEEKEYISFFVLRNLVFYFYPHLRKICFNIVKHAVSGPEIIFALQKHLTWRLEISYLGLQFLKKVQRQERIVEEIKMVLKPFYNRKKISKESYKEIMRKCVPKVRDEMSTMSNVSQCHLMSI